jgi:regulator of sigma E protease
MQLIGIVFNVVLVVLGVGLIICLHELGHFLMAKKNGVRVEVFSIGFGPTIFGFRRGETEYRVAWIPLGGYVKMAGEAITDERHGAPDELTSKTPWQRFQIFVAGATMNLLIAFPIAVLAFAAGKQEHSNEIGVPGTAEGQAGIRPGDVVVEVDGRRIDSLDKFRLEMVRRQTGTVVPVKVLRDGKELTVPVTAAPSEYHGTESASAMLDAVKEGSPLAAAGVKAGDEICGIDGQRVWSGADADARLRKAGGREVALRFRRRSEDFKDVEFDAKVTLPKRTWHVIPADENLVEARVGMVPKGAPGFGLLQPGDRIVRIGGKTIECWRDLKDAVEPAAGQRLEVTVERSTEEKASELKTFTVTAAVSELGTGRLGIAQHPGSGFFARVPEGSYFHKAGVRTGDRLVSIEGNPCRSFGGVPEPKVLPTQYKVPPIMGLRDEKPRTISIQVEGTDRKVREVKLVPEAVEEGDLAAVGFTSTPIGGLVTMRSKTFRRRAFGDAVREGMYEPVDVTVMTFEVLRKLLKGSESATGLSGPLGILHATYTFADQSFGNFVWMLCLITVNLGVFNLLPIPVLDGGHNVLLLIEVVRKWMGKPPPGERFVAAFQYSGLLFILALFVFVTYNDITRFFRG